MSSLEPKIECPPFFQALGVGLQNFGEQVEDQAGVGNVQPHQYSCLGNPMDTGAWRAPVPGVAKSSGMTEQLPLTHLLLTP